jgi:hypothetical protein
MKTLLAVTLAVVIAGPVGEFRDQAGAFEIGPVVQLANGRTVSTWDTHSGAIRSPIVNDFYTVDSLCVFSDNPQRDAARLAFGWHVESQVLSSSDAELVVKVTWRRTIEAGAQSDVGGAINVTLKPGSRVEIDRVSASSNASNASNAAGSCGATGMSLTVWMRPAR